MAGGTLNTLQGGKFGHGFVSAGITEAVSPAIANLGNDYAEVVAAAIVGGTTSVLSGGKFGNGAITSAFGYAFNELHDSSRKRTRGPDLNLDPPDSFEFSADNRMSNDPDLFELTAHGNKAGIEDGRSVDRPQINPEQIAALIQDHPNWKPGMAVKLYACSTGAGKNSVAQKLANRLDTIVIAPTTDVQVWLFGGYHFNRTQVKAGGHWKIFSPRVLKPQFERPKLIHKNSIGN